MRPCPTIPGFINFVRGEMGISPSVLPDGSQYFFWAYNQAISLVNRRIAVVPLQYMLAVYNLAGDILINLAQDPTGAPNVPGSNPPTPFFAWTRKQLNINSFVTGVVTSTSDQGTSQSMEVPEQVKTFTLADLQNLKTPWGRNYIGIAQAVGTDWGLS